MKEQNMDSKLNLAIDTIFLSLLTVWENNGNIMADAVRDNVLTNMSTLTGCDIEELEEKINRDIEEKQ